MTMNESNLSVAFRIGREAPEQSAERTAQLLRAAMLQKAARPIGDLSVHFSDLAPPVATTAMHHSVAAVVEFSGIPKSIAIERPVDMPGEADFSHA